MDKENSAGLWAEAAHNLAPKIRAEYHPMTTPKLVGVVFEGSVKEEVFINGILYRRVSEVAKSSAETLEAPEHIE